MRVGYHAGYRSLSYTVFDNYITKIQFRGLVSEEEPQMVHIGRAQSCPSTARQYWDRNGTLLDPQILFSRLYDMLKAGAYTYTTGARTYICLPSELHR